MAIYGPENDALYEACRGCAAELVRNETLPIGTQTEPLIITVPTSGPFNLADGTQASGVAPYSAVLKREEWGYYAKSDGSQDFVEFEFFFTNEDIDALANGIPVGGFGIGVARTGFQD